MTEPSLDQLIDVAALERFVNSNAAGPPGQTEVQQHSTASPHGPFHGPRGRTPRAPSEPPPPEAHSVTALTWG